MKWDMLVFITPPLIGWCVCFKAEIGKLESYVPVRHTRLMKLHELSPPLVRVKNSSLELDNKSLRKANYFHLETFIIAL